MRAFESLAYSFLFGLLSIAAHSQTLSLQQCLEKMNDVNPAIKVSNAVKEQQLWVYRQVKDAFIPSLSLSNQHNVSTGRVLDPTTYQFLTNRTVYDMSASVGGSLILFNGFERVKKKKKAKMKIKNLNKK